MSFNHTNLFNDYSYISEDNNNNGINLTFEETEINQFFNPTISNLN